MRIPRFVSVCSPSPTTAADWVGRFIASSVGRAARSAEGGEALFDPVEGRARGRVDSGGFGCVAGFGEGVVGGEGRWGEAGAGGADAGIAVESGVSAWFEVLRGFDQ